MRVRQCVEALSVAAILLCGFGCSKADIEGVFQKGTDAVEEKTATVKEVVREQVDRVGGIELKLDRPVKTARCYASLVVLSSGRPNVLQIAGYKDPAEESFPSVLLRAEVAADSPAALAGQQGAAQVYVQAEKDGPVWHSPDDQLVRLAVTSVDGTSIEGDVLGGTLVNTETGQTVDVTGKFSGRFLTGDAR